MDLKKWFRWKTMADKVESTSFILLIIAAIFTIFGISVGTFIPGIPVAITIIGAFLVVGSIVLYLVSEFVRIIKKK